MADDQNRYETGARKYPAKTSPDAADEFSQMRPATSHLPAAWD
ncbi:hypothetical protein [Mesorhizobium sp. M1295]